jgi:hypothetical protein
MFGKRRKTQFESYQVIIKKNATLENVIDFINNIPIVVDSCSTKFDYLRTCGFVELQIQKRH